MGFGFDLTFELWHLTFSSMDLLGFRIFGALMELRLEGDERI